MPEKEVILTPAGLQKLEAELEQLKTVKRSEVADRIRQAIDFGDITENSEYDDAKNEQAFVEGRIITLEKILRHARIIESQHTPGGEVGVGSRVVLKDLTEGKEMEFMLVGSVEADPEMQRLSVESPVGRAILGQQVGNVVTVKAPDGQLQYQILRVE